MGQSRRRFLLAGAGLAAIAGGGIAATTLIETDPTERPRPSGWLERNGRLRSRYMHEPVGWTVVRPRGLLHGIVFCLHGYEANHRFAFDDVRVPTAAHQVGLQVAVAAVDGGADSYWHKRSDGTDSLAMLLDEFVPLVRGMVGKLPQALMGWSMGGYGALLAAERAPAKFVAVAPASPAIWLSPGATAPGAFDSPADFDANDIFDDLDALRRMAIAVACGTSDPFYMATNALVARMDYPHSVFFGPGSHDATYWASVAPDQLRAIAPVFT
jgi:alpha-beta hydrolase superfamily lysophospholipase